MTTDMTEAEDEVEMQIRNALQHEASAYEVPDDLVARTLEVARERVGLSWREEWAVWFDTRRMARSESRRSRQRPGWIYAAVVPMLAGLFAVGSLVSNQAERFGDESDKSSVSLQRDPTAKALTDDGQGGDTAEKRDSANAKRYESEQLFSGGVPGIAPAATAAPGTTPQLVRTVDLEVSVGKGTFEQKWASANEVAARHGGSVSTSLAELLPAGSNGSLSMRVPASKLEATLADLRRLGTLVRMNRSGTDVSGQLTDFDARLRNLRAQESQLLVLLKQTKRAAEVSDIRGRLDGMRQEIESVDGQRAALQRDVDTSTIQFTLREGPGAGSDSDSKVERAFDRGGDAFTTTLAGSVIVVGYVGPFALMVLIAWLLRSRRRAI